MLKLEVQKLEVLELEVLELEVLELGLLLTIITSLHLIRRKILHHRISLIADRIWPIS